MTTSVTLSLFCVLSNLGKATTRWMRSLVANFVRRSEDRTKVGVSLRSCDVRDGADRFVGLVVKGEQKSDWSIEEMTSSFSGDGVR
jgi:hypothetical protein